MGSEETAGAKALRSEKDPVPPAYNSRVHRRARREGAVAPAPKSLMGLEGSLASTRWEREGQSHRRPETQVSCTYVRPPPGTALAGWKGPAKSLPGGKVRGPGKGLNRRGPPGLSQAPPSSSKRCAGEAQPSPFTCAWLCPSPNLATLFLS